MVVFTEPGYQSCRCIQANLESMNGGLCHAIEHGIAVVHATSTAPFMYPQLYTYHNEFS